jgi:hypothetical protein
MLAFKSSLWSRSFLSFFLSTFSSRCFFRHLPMSILSPFMFSFYPFYTFSRLIFTSYNLHCENSVATFSKCFASREVPFFIHSGHIMLNFRFNVIFDIIHMHLIRKEKNWSDYNYFPFFVTSEYWFQVETVLFSLRLINFVTLDYDVTFLVFSCLLHVNVSLFSSFTLITLILISLHSSKTVSLTQFSKSVCFKIVQERIYHMNRDKRHRYLNSGRKPVSP